jgi:hypothetical protein
MSLDESRWVQQVKRGRFTQSDNPKWLWCRAAAPWFDLDLTPYVVKICNTSRRVVTSTWERSKGPGQASYITGQVKLLFIDVYRPKLALNANHSSTSCRFFASISFACVHKRACSQNLLRGISVVQTLLPLSDLTIAGCSKQLPVLKKLTNVPLLLQKMLFSIPYNIHMHRTYSCCACALLFTLQLSRAHVCWHCSSLAVERLRVCLQFDAAAVEFLLQYPT